MGSASIWTHSSMKLLIVVLGLISTSYCLYEDQVGKFDWLQNYVGKVKFALADSSGKRAVVATEQNVVAALNLKTGQILWRQILEKEGHGTIHFLGTAVSGETVAIVGDVHGLVRSFDLISGALVWEWALPTGVALDRALWSIVAEKLYVVTPFGQKFVVQSFNLRSGSRSESWDINASWAGTSKCVLSGQFIACLSDNVLNSASFVDRGSRFQSMELAQPAGSLSPVSSGDVAAVLVQYSSEKPHAGQVVFFKDGELPRVRCEPWKLGAAVQVVAPEGGQGKVFFVQLIPRHESIDIFTTDCVTGKMMEELSGNVAWPASLAAPKIAASVCGVKRDESFLCRLLLHTDDHGVALLQYPGKVLWQREEALASISLVEMLDLPVSDTDAAIEKEFDSKEAGVLSMFGRRLVSQIMQLQDLFMTVLGLKKPSQPTGGRFDLVRDEFGLHKIMVLATAAAKVFGVDNLSGEIVWQRSLSDVDTSAMQLFVQRSTRHAPFDAQCTLLLKDRVTKEGVLYTFNPMTGMGKIERLGYGILQAMLLPALDAESLRPLLLLDSSESLHLVPRSAHSVALPLAKTLYMYVANPITGVIAGYSLADSTPERLVASKVWEVVLQPGTQTIKSIVGKSPHERVHSQGRVLADRSVLYKYVNPNLVAVVIQGTDPVHKCVLNIILLDAVSGAVIFSVSHKRAREPVHLVHSENWLVYTYFSEKWRRTEVAAIELYEGKTQSSASFSSLEAPIQPLVERQSYILPAMVQAMRPTVTEKGITSRHILVGLTSGAVLELPWIFVDPRRPVANTPEMREEGVVPYVPELPIPAEFFINYNRTLPRISGIHTAPSGLESTSLVLVYGLDLFYTRVAPSKTFDLLKEDFDPFLISMVLIGLCLASYMTRRLASRKALKQAWK